MRSTCARVLGVLILFTATSARADRPWVVGEFGDFSRIEFRGNDSFSRETLVAALDSDFGMLKASRPLATLAMLLSTIQIQLAQGYSHSGFPDATVTADFDETAQHVVVDIVEGPQFLNGPIIVQGVDLNLQQLLVERLSKVEPVVTGTPVLGLWPPHAADNPPKQALWIMEKPTSFEPFTASELERLSLEALHEAGYLDARVRVQLEPDRVLRVTRLIIAVTPGTAASIGRIEITGLQRHTTVEIEQFLEIEVGQSCDLFARREWEQQLEASGRFATHAITTTPMVDPPGRHVVRIELSECEEVPPLSEELNEIDRALLRAADWLAHPQNFGSDIIVHGTGDLSVLCGYFQATPEEAVAGDPAADIPATPVELPAWLDGADASFDLALSPRGDSFLTTKVSSAEGEMLFGYGFEFTSERTALYSSATANCISFDNESGPLPSATVTFIRTPTSATGDKYSVMFGFGVSSSGGVLQIRMTPAFMLTNAHSEGATFEIRDGVLHAEWDSVRSQFDVETGRLILCECTADDGSELTIRIQPFGLQPSNLFSVLSDGTSFDSYDNLNNDLAPELACGTFLADEAAWWANRLGNSSESSRWEAVGRLLRNFDQSNSVETVSFTTDSSEEEESKFTIPANQALAANPLAWVGQFVLWGNTAVLSRNSPAWQVGREAVSALALGDFTAFVELERLSRDERCGPLTSLYAAELLRFVHPALSQAWANQGLRRLDAVSLAKDLEVLASADTTVGRFLIELLGELGQLPADELQAVFAGIGNEWLDDVIRIATNANETPDARLTQLLQILWSAGLKDGVEQRLHHHAVAP